MKPLTWPTVMLGVLTLGAVVTVTSPFVTALVAAAFIVCAALDLTRNYRRSRREHRIR